LTIRKFITVAGALTALAFGVLCIYAAAAIGDAPATGPAAPATYTLPTTRPAMVGVFLQPKRTLATWAARGVTVAIGRDREQNADGSDGVTRQEWVASANAAGLDHVIDPSGDPAADSLDPHCKGFLCPFDEPEGQIINAQDAQKAALARGDAAGAAKAKADEEAVYVACETFYATNKAAAPNVPVYISFDANQFQYHRADYTRLFKACDRFTVDYYPVQRGLPVTEYARLIDLVRAWPGGDKLRLAWIECSYQHLNPTYFPGKRAPGVAEWLQEVKQATDRGMSVGWFPQQIGEDGAGFSVDATTPPIAAAMVAWFKLATSGNGPPAGGVGAAGGSSADPLAGTVITLPNGRSYVLQPK
jgi:hypothetical protein